MTSRAGLAAVCMAGVALAPAAAAQAATTGTVSGTLSGATIPSKLNGVAEVRAVSLATGEIAGAQRVGRTGAYTMKLPPGAYTLVAAVFDRKAGTIVTPVSQPLSLRAGQKRAVPVGPKKKKRAKKKRAKASYVQESGRSTPGVIAIEVYDFTGATGELAVLNRGMADMILVDIMNSTGCPVALVANARDRRYLTDELALQSSRYVDPSTRVVRDFILADVAVKGKLVSRAGALAYEIRIVNSRTGGLIDSKTGTIKTDAGFWPAIEAIGPDIRRRICNPPPPVPPPPPPPPPIVDPDALSGTFSGSTDYLTSPAPVPIRLSWTGRLDLTRTPYGFSPTVTYPMLAGSVTVTMTGTIGGCAVDGAVDLDLVGTNPGGAGMVVAVEPGDAPAYRLGLAAPLGVVIGVKHDCASPSDNGQQVQWPLLGVALLFTPEPQVAGSRFGFNGTLNGKPEPASPSYNWTWSLSGAR